MPEVSPPTQTLLDRMIAERQLTASDAAAFAQARSVPGGTASEEPTEREVLEWLAREYGVGFLPLDSVEAEREVLALFPARILLKEELLPLRRDQGTIEVATCRLFATRGLDTLRSLTGQRLRVVLVPRESLLREMKKNLGVGADTIGALDEEKTVQVVDENAEDSNLDAGAEDEASIIRFVNQVLKDAIELRASDVHLEPFEDEFRIRYRIDGSLYEMAPPPKNLAPAVIARVKVLSALNIAERRVPQDGRIKTTIGGRAIDLRVSTLPTQFGESVVLRILDKTVVNLSLDALSMQDDIKEGIRQMVNRPNGIFIVTGPTGSGKTTTLYSALREVNTEDIKILTAEDPVEYEVEGIMQVPINHQVGLTFAAALRSFLRQDPDTIMVGEIRDLETAQIAVQASLTGHVVLSTLHTNDAPGAVTRLIDMGLEPFLISASLEGVLAQRLLRRICRSCKTAYEPDKEVVSMLEVDALEIAGKQFFFGKGCPECNRSGYRGRQGLFELMPINDGIRTLITQKAPTLVLKQKSVESGMRPLREDGLRCIFDGLTTIEEVLKYT